MELPRAAGSPPGWETPGLCRAAAWLLQLSPSPGCVSSTASWPRSALGPVLSPLHAPRARCQSPEAFLEGVRLPCCPEPLVFPCATRPAPGVPSH